MRHDTCKIQVYENSLCSCANCVKEYKEADPPPQWIEDIALNIVGGTPTWADYASEIDRVAVTIWEHLKRRQDGAR